MENINSSSAISNAIAILREEESTLKIKLAKLQGRINSVQSAIASMSELVDSDSELPIVNSVAITPKNTIPSTAQEGVSFTKALAKFMSTVEKPLGVGEIAKQMEASGYAFSAKNKSAQVSTALIRNKDLYRKTENDKKWSVIQKPLI
jgi:glutathione synthase/RimK-type ligase-like ATP-grasp enzyme